MTFKKFKVTLSILMSVMIITSQSTVFAESYSDVPSESESFNVISTTYDSISGKVIPQKKYTSKNTIELGQTQPALSGNDEEKSYVLVDSNSDLTSTPVSIPSECVTSYEMESGGDINVAYIFDGKHLTGKYLEKDIRRTLHSTPLDALLKYRPADEVATSLGLDTLKEFAKASSKEIIIAVIDTGVDANHSLLKDRLVRGYDVIDEDFTVDDEGGHGTHVAGIIALSTPDNVKIMPIDVFEDDSALDSSIVEGIYYAVKNGAKIINLSLGGFGKTTYLENSIKYARKNGVMVVVSSGNDAHDNKFDYPAAFEEVVTVGATNNSGALLYYSNHGESVDISAPGEKIVSAYVDGSTESLSGTSMAAPFVSAVAAMLWLDQSGATLEAVEASLFENTKDLGPSGKDIAFGHGEIEYSNYKSDENFYMIGHFTDLDQESPEFKYDLPLRYYLGEKVKSISFKVDEKVVKNENQGNAVFESNIDIRGLSNGSHTITADITFEDGHTEQVLNQTFVIPEYNVRIRVFDLYGEDITISPNKGEIGYLIENSEYNTFRQTKFIYQPQNPIRMNIDFTKEAEKNLYYYFSYAWYTDEVPTYLRGFYTSGDYMLEPTESVLNTCQSDIKTNTRYSVSYALPTVLDYHAKIDNVKWNEYKMSPLNNTYSDSYDDKTTGFNTFDFYHDQYDFKIKAICKIKDNQGESSDVVIFEDFNSELDQSQIFNEDLKHLKVEFNSIAKPNYFNLWNSLIDHFSFNISNSDVYLPEGVYDIDIRFEQVISDTETLVYSIRNKFDFISTNDYVLKIDDTLESQVWISLSENLIFNKWLTTDGSYVSAILSIPSVKYDQAIPNLVLKNIVTSNEVIIKGSRSFIYENTPAELYGSDSYFLNNVPDGTYEVKFQFETPFDPFKIHHPYTVVTIKNNRVVTEKNTAPKSVDDLSITIPPLEKISLDLNNLFWDNEQGELYFSASEGAVINNRFYYQDILKKDKTIEITAYDGVGGSTKLNLQLLIGDTFALENDFIPIKEIITIGASDWSVKSIQKAIDRRIVNNDVLEAYQASISRSEISEQLVKVIEKNKGKLSTTKGISFFDTQNEAVLKLASIGVMGGLGEGVFGPDKNITRQELAVILYKAAKIMTGKTLVTSNAIQGFSDWNTVSNWAKESLTFCVNNKILTGSNGKLSPKGNVTREQAIVMLVKLLEGVEAKTLK